ncbi:MAG: flagellar protein [Rhodobacterales bacterium]|nr:MAG: flagellar protein [Rhodobacterales bacterium]
MAFQPVIPLSGLVGWKFLERTHDRQTEAFNSSSDVVRDTDYFAGNIGDINTAEELVSDRRLLRVALGAFGLQDDIDNKFFIRKVLEEGVIDTTSLANKMSDDRYHGLAEAFGFGDFDVPNTKMSTFPGEIVELYRARSFEVAVGEQDETLRFALNAKRELAEIANDSASDDTKWYTIMGNAPLRQVFETALGLPSSFAQLDLDQQLEVFRDKATAQFGDGEVSQFSTDAAVESLVQRYLVRAQIADIQTISSGSIALTLLQS